MNTFTFVVTLMVEVPAFTADDARECLADEFGRGNYGMTKVTDIRIEEEEIVT